MSSILDWFTKKSLLVIGFLGSIIFFVSVRTNIHIPVDVCYRGDFCGNISEFLKVYSFPFVSLFVFSLIIFHLRNITFVAWKNFSIWAIPISLFIISLFPVFTDGMDFFPITKRIVSLAITILYSIISLTLITYKSLRKE